MKTSCKLILLFLFMTNIAFAQSNFIFSVNSNPSVNLGIKVQQIVFTLGTDFSYAYSKNEVEILNQTNTDEYSAITISPGFGIKLYLSESDFSPFIFASLSKEIPVTVEVKGDLYSKRDIEDRFDDFVYRVGGGTDFEINESLLIGFEIGLYIRSNSSSTSLIENESTHISTLSNVTLTYVFD